MRRIVNNATFNVETGKIAINPLKYMDNARTLSTEPGVSFKDEIIQLLRSGKDKAEIFGFIELALRATRQDRAAAMGELAFDKWIRAMCSRHYVEAEKKMQRLDGNAPSTSARTTIRRSASKIASLEEIASAIAERLELVPEETLEMLSIQDISVPGKEIAEYDFMSVLNVLYTARKFA